MKWMTRKVGDLCKVGRGSSPRPKADPQYFDGGDIPWVKVADATASGKYLYETQETVNAYGAKFSRLLPAGSLIICTSGTLGLTKFLGVNGCIHDGWLYTYDYNGIEPEFLYYFLQTQQPYFASVASGAAIQNISTDILRNTPIYLPDVPDQVRIASVLSAYDDLIENNRRRMALLEESARLLYQEWFVRLRFPGHEHVRVIDGVPEGWDAGVIGDFYKTASGGTPSRSIPEFFTGDIPWVKTQELPNGFILDTNEKITEDAVKHSSAKIFSNQTLLVALYGATVGEVGILSMDAATNQACCAVMPKDDRAHFVHSFLFFRENKSQLMALSAGAAQNNISQQIIREYNMLMPPKSLMRVFVGALKPVFGQLLNLSRQNKKLREARDLLLPRLMSGEVPV
jgi:type I restriction enzyme S subunit